MEHGMEDQQEGEHMDTSRTEHSWDVHPDERPVSSQHLREGQLRDVVLEACARLMQQYGGPMQYLMERYEDSIKKQEYMNWLWKCFPPDPATVLRTRFPLPCFNGPQPGDGGSCILHIAMLSFDTMSTPHEPTRAKTCLELVDSILTSTFLTKHEPLLLCSGEREPCELGVDPAWIDFNPGASGSIIQPFAIGHHKSAARVSTLHLILSLFMEDDVDVQKACPSLWQSVRELNCFDTVFKNDMEAMFSNFQLSHRGAIRRPPNVISWCVALSKLQAKGEDCATVIRAWNSQSTKSSQLTGQKAVGVKNLLELCDDRTRKLILDCVSKHGWENCPFSDDTFSIRKLFPGQHWRSSSPQWTQRLVVTNESMHNLFLAIVSQHDQLPSMLQKKLKRPQVEEMAQLAALATALFHEAVAAGLSASVVKERWLNEWISKGDAKLEMELASTLQEKSSNFTLRDIPSLRLLLDQKASQHNPVLAGEENLVVNKGQDLEASTFDLVMKKIEYDCNVWRVYKKNVEQWQHRVHQKVPFLFESLYHVFS